MGDYEATYRASIEGPRGFWGAAAEAVDWRTRPERCWTSPGAPLYRWFSDGRLNTCYNALDRHVIHGRADQAALIYDSPVTGTRRTYTYAQLLEHVALFAGRARVIGVKAGDRVVISMPMVPEAVIGMLACARIGAVHSVVFGGSRPRSWRCGSTTPSRR